MPYRLPPTTPEMPRPSLTMDRPGPFAPDEVVTVTSHDPPPNVDLDRLLLGQCSAEDLRIVDDCTYRFGHVDAAFPTAPFVSMKIAGGCAAPPCYLAVTPPAKGLPRSCPHEPVLAEPLNQVTISAVAALSKTRPPSGLASTHDGVAGLVVALQQLERDRVGDLALQHPLRAGAPRSRGRSPILRDPVLACGVA